MKLSSFSPDVFCLEGECPHCHRLAAFLSITKPFEEGRDPLGSRWIAALCCVACNGYILGIVRFVRETEYRAVPVYETHYPLGTPDDSVSAEVPSSIRTEFQEGL